MTIDVEHFTQRRNDDRWNRVSVGDVIERMTWNEPDKIALIATDDATVNPAHARVSYAKANGLVNQVANGLLALGLESSARIAMICETSVEAWLTKIGIAKAGLVAAPINVMMAPEVIAESLSRVGAKAAVVDEPLWRELSGELTEAGICPIVTIGLETVDGVPGFDEFVTRQSQDEPDVRIHGDDIWEVLFTSGTTASPKAVMVSHVSTYMAAYSHMLTLTRGLDHEADIVSAAFTPMVYHIGDHVFVFGPLICGGTALIGRKPDGHSMAKACTEERVTCLFGGSPQFVEELVRAVNESPEIYNLTSITIMTFGWAPMAPESLQAFKAICNPHVKVYELIGQTEAVACHRFFIDRHQERHLREAPAINHVGKPSPIMAATVFDEDGNDLRANPNQAGEAVFRSPVMFSGYYRDQTATEDALRGGWFHSGDSFKFGEDGIRLMVDRYKDIVKSGGENVSSIRVESVLQQHPAIARAAVVGVPDDRWGEAVTACVILQAGMTIDTDELVAFARERLAGFETPKQVVAMDDFPTTVGGKVLKYQLRAKLEAAAKKSSD